MHSLKLSSQTSTAETDLAKQPAVIAELRCSCCCHYYRKLSGAQHMQHVRQFANLEVQSGEEEEEEEEEKLDLLPLLGFLLLKTQRVCRNVRTFSKLAIYKTGQ